MNGFADIESIERRAAAIGLSIESLLKAAKVHRATWYRWKAKSYEPRWRSWRRLEAALRRRERRAAKNGAGT